MTLAAENMVAGCLCDVQPRPGFAVELLTALTHDPHHLHALEVGTHRSRTRWIVAGAVAGVVSATGAVYWGARRHPNKRHRGAA